MSEDHTGTPLRALSERAVRFARARLGAERQAPRSDLQEQLASVPPEDRRIVELALPYTMTGIPRLQSLIDAVRYLVARELPGAFVECGVWRGGSVLAMIATLQELGSAPRDIWLYDTFEGMTEPTEHDTSAIDGSALATWHEAQARGERPWNELFDGKLFNESQVRETVLGTGYPPERVHFVRGPVEATLPEQAPGSELALLRLDTDWYESTRHELEHLYPRLCTGGVLIIDDYGHFDGARRAVEEYFAPRETLLLNRIDYTARIAIKC
jgi:O-methyltransferase